MLKKIIKTELKQWLKDEGFVTDSNKMLHKMFDSYANTIIQKLKDSGIEDKVNQELYFFANNYEERQSPDEKENRRGDATKDILKIILED